MLSSSELSPLLDSQEVQQHAPTTTQAQTHERKIKSSWKIGRKWHMDMKPHGGHVHGYMKCFACEEFCINLPRGLEAGYKIMQKSSICDNKKKWWSQICGG